MQQNFHIPNGNEMQIADVSIKEYDSEEVQGANIPPLHPRILFLRKLYPLMCLSLFCVIVISVLLTFLLQIKCFKSLLLLIIVSILIIVTLIIIYYKKSNLLSPFKNLLLFCVFYFKIVLLLSCLISNSNNLIFLMLFIEADAILFSLSIYSLITQHTLTYHVATLFVLSPIFIVFNLFLLFTSISLELLIFVSMIQVIWGFYMLYETQSIMKGPPSDIERNDIFIESIAIYASLFLMFLLNSELIKDIMITRKSSKPHKNFSNSLA